MLLPGHAQGVGVYTQLNNTHQGQTGDNKGEQERGVMQGMGWRRQGLAETGDRQTEGDWRGQCLLNRQADREHKES